MGNLEKSDQLAAGIGAKIRSLRHRLGLTLDQVAGAAGISKPFLSQVERARATPSVSSLTRIANALGATMSYFIEPASEGRNVRRARDTSFFSFIGSSATYARLSGTLPDRKLELLMVEMPARQKESEMATRAMEEFVYVVAGELVISLESESFHLVTGDSVHYRSTTSLRWLNPSARKTIVLWGGTPTLL